jgi:hypothetical protein
MNATLDQDLIKRTAQSVKPAGMGAAEGDLSAIHAQQYDVCAQIGALKDIASGAHQSSLKMITKEDRVQAQSRLDQLNARSAELQQAAATIRERIRAFDGEQASAVRSALTPLRKAAAKRVLSSITELTVAIDALNASTISLKESGTEAVMMPKPLLTGMLAIAQSIITARTPEEEKR